MASTDRLLQCVVVTPERTVFDEPVEFVALPLFDGELGLLPRHTPLIGRLGYGELRARRTGTVRRFFVDAGFAQVRDDVVTVLTQRAVPVADLDDSVAAKDLEQARARVATTDEQLAEKTRAEARARAMLRLGARE